MAASASADPVTADLSAEFNRPAQPVPWEDPDIDEEEMLETEPLKFADAEAELERLEAGRAAPDLQHNLKPARRLEQAVHTHIEEKREFRIAALRAFLEFNPDGPQHDTEYARHDDLEFSL